MQNVNKHQILNNQDKYLNTMFKECKKKSTLWTKYHILKEIQISVSFHYPALLYDQWFPILCNSPAWPQPTLVRFIRFEYGIETDWAMQGFLYIIMVLIAELYWLFPLHQNTGWYLISVYKGAHVSFCLKPQCDSARDCWTLFLIHSW